MSERRGRDERDNRRGGRPKKKLKEKLMDESNQTEEERRELRMQQRALKQEVIEQRADIADPTKANMRELTKKNSKCFENVRYTREAVTDAENLKLISEAASGQVKMVTQGALGIDVDKFTADLRSHFAGASDDGEATESFNWVMLGANVAYLYHTVPPAVGFMMGPLDKPAKGPRASNKTREKKPTDDDAEEVVPDTQEPEIGKKAKHKKDQTEMRISKMRAHESKKPRQKQDMFEALFNPKSFTQTVENVFDFSFFVKSGEGAISMDEDTGLPTVLFKQQCGRDEDPNLSAKQWLFTISPAEFREMMMLYGIEESNIRHRDEGPKSDYYDPLAHGKRGGERQ